MHYTASSEMKLWGIFDIFKIIFLQNKRTLKYTEKKKQTSDKIQTISQEKKISVYLHMCMLVYNFKENYSNVKNNIRVNKIVMGGRVLRWE